MMTTNEINQSLQTTVRVYISSLDNYPEEQFAFKRDHETWSLGQMYEHLYLTSNFFFLANVVRCLEQRKGQIGGDKNKYGENAFKYGGFPPVKIQIPEPLQGPAPIAKEKAAYKALFEKVLIDAESQIEAINKDEGQYKTYHAGLGWLNAHEWFYNMEMHFRHHLRQKAELEQA